MRNGTQNRRNRGRGRGGNRSNNNRSKVYDSNGPDVRIRGTAHQVAEKYQVLAKDAASAGDVVLAESYYQYAEHYVRIINAFSDERDSQSIDVVTNAQNSDQDSDDDLSLPSSILGGGVDSKSEKEFA